MSRFIESVFEKLKRHPKRIVFPEGTEPNVLRAAKEFARLKLGTPILLGHRDTVEKAVAKGRTIYGLNTGFGRLSDTRIDAKGLEALQEGEEESRRRVRERQQAVALLAELEKRPAGERLALIQEDARFHHRGLFSPAAWRALARAPVAAR